MVNAIDRLAAAVDRAWIASTGRHGRARLALATAVLVLGGVAVSRVFIEDSDFVWFHTGARTLLADGTLHPDIQRYPPTYPALLAPLGLLPIGAAAVLWVGMNLAALAALPGAFARLGVPVRSQGPAWLAAAPFVWDSVVLAQNGPLLLYLVTTAIGRARQGRARVGGFLIGIGACLKVLPAGFLPVPVALGSARRTMIGMALAAVVATGALAAAVGPARGVELGSEWIGAMRANHSHAAYARNEAMLRFTNEALAITLVRTLTTVAPIDAEGAVRLAAWPPPVAWTLYGLVLASTILVWLTCARRRPATEADGPWLDLYALTAVLVLIASPLVWSHYFIWLLPALVVLHHRPRLLLGCFVVSILGFGSIHARGLGIHMGVALLLFGVVAVERFRRRPRQLG